MRNIPPAVKSIIIINILVMIMARLDPNFMIEKFALFYPTSQYFHWWQLITHVFLHHDFTHLFFNMYAVFLFGSVLERQWGTKKFLLFYFISALGAVLVNWGIEWVQIQHWMTQAAEGDAVAFGSIVRLKMIRAFGASGAVFGLLMGYAMLYPDSIMGLVFPPITMKAKWFVLIYAAIELLAGVAGPQDGIGHFAHLGGLITAFFLLMYWRKTRKLYSRID